MEEKIINGIKYRLDKETLTAEVIRKRGYSGDIVIPDTVVSKKVSYKVTSIGESAFANCKSLTSISIPNSVTSIGDCAFYFSSLTSIEVNANNQNYASIDGVLYNKDVTTLICCPGGKTSITIPNSVTSIGSSAFSSCKALTSITIPNSVTSIGDYAFYYCSSLTSITIPDSVTSIEHFAFSFCKSLTSIIISNSVTSIGNFAFDQCKSLTSISIPDSVTTIGDYVFERCEFLTSINISKSVINIGKQIFEHCKSLTTIVVDENNQVYDSRDNCNAIIHTATNTLIFGCCKTTIPNSVTNIGDYAFKSYPSLTAITIPDSVTSIGDFAFSFCDSLASVIIPNSVMNIGKGAFRCCESLTTINIPDSVTNIRWIAFAGCSSLSSITIPNGVTTIEKYAFENCESLTSITIPASVTNIDLCVFLNCPSLTSIIVDENNKVYDSRENCNAIIHTETDTLIAGCQNTIIPQSVINIGTCAFGKCSTLTTISIPDSVENIAGYAFYKCKSLSEINIPYSVTTIGSCAFEDCESLTSISISDVPVEDEELYNQADNFFDNLGIGENLSLKINSSSVFTRCSSLTSVLISKHTTSIGNMTFDGCKSLIDIRYTGTIEQWQEIKLGTCWNRDVPTKIVHCTNGDVEVEIEE